MVPHAMQGVHVPLCRLQVAIVERLQTCMMTRRADSSTTRNALEQIVALRNQSSNLNNISVNTCVECLLSRAWRPYTRCKRLLSIMQSETFQCIQLYIIHHDAFQHCCEV
jgi:hypothetical protein